MRRGLNKYIENWFAETGAEDRFIAKSRKPMTLLEWACAVTEGRQHRFDKDNVHSIAEVLIKVNPHVMTRDISTTYTQMCIGGRQSDRLLYANVTRDVHQRIALVVAETNAMVEKAKLDGVLKIYEQALLDYFEEGLMVNAPAEVAADKFTNWTGKQLDRFGIDFTYREEFEELSAIGLSMGMTALIFAAPKVGPVAVSRIAAVDFMWDAIKVPKMLGIMKDVGWSGKFAVDGAWDFRNQEGALRNSHFLKKNYSPFFYYGGDKGGQGLFMRKKEGLPGLFHYDDMTFMAYGAAGNHFFGKLSDKTEAQFLIEYGNYVVSYEAEEEIIKEAVKEKNQKVFLEFLQKINKYKKVAKTIGKFALEKSLEYVQVVGTAAEYYQPALKYGFYGWAPTRDKD